MGRAPIAKGSLRRLKEPELLGGNFDEFPWLGWVKDTSVGRNDAQLTH
jgi:hypothetical protein